MACCTPPRVRNRGSATPHSGVALSKKMGLGKAPGMEGVPEIKPRSRRREDMCVCGQAWQREASGQAREREQRVQNARRTPTSSSKEWREPTRHSDPKSRRNPKNPGLHAEHVGETGHES